MSRPRHTRSRVARLARASARQPLALVQAGAVLPVLTMALRRVRASTAARVLDMLPAPRLSPSRPPRTDDIAACGDVVDVISALSPVPTTCLSRALTLRWLLGRRRIASELVYGVRVEDHFAAHAWVEVDGRPLGRDGRRGVHYAPLRAEIDHSTTTLR